MRLGDDITVTIGIRPIVLRPSLRAATRLERGGFGKLLSQIADGNLGTIAHVVSESSDTDILRDIHGAPLNDVMRGLINGVGEHVLALAGADNPTPSDTGPRMTHAEFHARLFKIATGWLAWSPDQAWNATSAEILEAYSARLEMLRAIHGGTEADESARTAPDDAVLDRGGLHSLRALGATV